MKSEVSNVPSSRAQESRAEKFSEWLTLIIRIISRSSFFAAFGAGFGIIWATVHGDLARSSFPGIFSILAVGIILILELSMSFMAKPLSSERRKGERRSIAKPLVHAKKRRTKQR